jgi:hypothetical protein
VASRESCIEHPAQASFVILRDEYMALCDNDACAAMLLHVFEHWTNTKLRQLEERGKGDLWIFRSREQLRDEDLCGAFGLRRIDNALERLRILGFLDRRNNPKPQFGWDRMYQYLFNAQAVQAFVNGWKSQSLKRDEGADEREAPKLTNGRNVLSNGGSNTTHSANTPQATSATEVRHLGREDVEGVPTYEEAAA